MGGSGAWRCCAPRRGFPPARAPASTTPPPAIACPPRGPPLAPRWSRSRPPPQPPPAVADRTTAAFAELPPGWPRHASLSLPCAVGLRSESPADHDAASFPALRRVSCPAWRGAPAPPIVPKTRHSVAASVIVMILPSQPTPSSRAPVAPDSVITQRMLRALGSCGRLAVFAGHTPGARFWVGG